MSLAIADLTVGLFVMPISSAYAITGNQNSVCIIFGRNLENAIELQQKANILYSTTSNSFKTKMVG